MLLTISDIRCGVLLHYRDNVIVVYLDEDWY